MKKKILENILSELLIPLGFKKKGNYWVLNGNELTKMVHLQKSQFNNSFYINYGYILNSIPLDSLAMHIYNRVSSPDEQEKQKLIELLDLEKSFSDDTRSKELSKILHVRLLDNMEKINSDQDLYNHIKTLAEPLFNMIPLSIKKHFKLLNEKQF